MAVKPEAQADETDWTWFVLLIGALVIAYLALWRARRLSDRLDEFMASERSLAAVRDRVEESRQRAREEFRQDLAWAIREGNRDRSE